MSEPKAFARRIEEIAGGLYSWHLSDDRIGGAQSDAFAVRSGGKVTLIDPLPVDETALAQLGPVEAIVLTAANHQRSCWRLRQVLSVPVWAPAGPEVGDTPGMLERRPDHRFRHGDALPGGLLAFHAPGPAIAMYALWWPERSALFLSDLLSRTDGALRFVPAEYQDDPVRTRESVRLLLETFPLELACFSHGRPLKRAARRSIEKALSEDVELLARKHAQPHPDG